MKKAILFMFLGLITLNSNLFSMKEQSPIEKKDQELTKKDMVKIGAASIGCVFFTAACLLSHDTYIKVHSLPKNSRFISNLPFYDRPSAICTIPFNMALHLVPNNWRKSFEQNIGCCPCSIGSSLAGISSAALSYILGSYIYKKLSALRSKSRPTQVLKL